MTIATRVEMVGVKDTIRSLSKIDKTVRRQFTKDATNVARPIIDEAVKEYPDEALSGMARSWKHRGRELFPYDRRRAIRGLRVKVDTRRNRGGAAIKIVQSNPAAAILETAGKKTSNQLGDNLTRKFQRASRLLWPIADRKLPEVQDEMQALVLKAMHQVQREVR